MHIHLALSQNWAKITHLELTYFYFYDFLEIKLENA